MRHGPKKAFALRINEDILKAVEKWAADEFRSTNGQIEWMLSQYLKEHKPQYKTKSDIIVTFFMILNLVLCSPNKNNYELSNHLYQRRHCF